jgi:hypothetical protein
MGPEAATTVDEFVVAIKDKALPCPLGRLAKFERAIGQVLPDDYRRFLMECNGGYVGGRFWFRGPTPECKPADAGVHHIGGFQDDSCVSLEARYERYQGDDPPRIPRALVWIMDDPFGNAICLGVKGKCRGRVYFWDHEREPDESWNGTQASAGNLQLLANSFTEFVAGLGPTERE